MKYCSSTGTLHASPPPLECPFPLADNRCAQRLERALSYEVIEGLCAALC